MIRFLMTAAAAAGALCASVAAAAPVLDCPLRDVPFSLESPLVDVLLSPAARGVLDEAAPGRLQKIPEMFVSTTPPTFAAILTLRSGALFAGLDIEEVNALDPKLRALPVTDADKAARCARYDDERVSFDLPAGKPRLLLFEKMTGFRDGPSVEAARAAFQAMAARKGWALAVTDKGGAIHPETLRQFDAVIWNNVSGDVLTLTQREVLKQYVEAGGGFAAVHGSAGDPAYFWDWYADTLIGARFQSHPAEPQFQDARIVVNPAHPLATGLPSEWTMNDEWYSFKTNPRSVGAQVVLTLDESTYKPVGSMGMDLRMGDHPLAWTNCVGKGRMFYSAIGHRPETYSHPTHVALLENALGWVASGQPCAAAGERG